MDTEQRRGQEHRPGSSPQPQRRVPGPRRAWVPTAGPGHSQVGRGAGAVQPLLSPAPSGFILLMHRAGPARALDPGTRPQPSGHRAPGLLSQDTRPGAARQSQGCLCPAQPHGLR